MKEIFMNDGRWKITIERPELTTQERKRRLEILKKSTVELLRESIRVSSK